MEAVEKKGLCSAFVKLQLKVGCDINIMWSVLVKVLLWLNDIIKHDDWLCEIERLSIIILGVIIHSNRTYYHFIGP